MNKNLYHLGSLIFFSAVFLSIDTEPWQSDTTLIAGLVCQILNLMMMAFYVFKLSKE